MTKKDYEAIGRMIATWESPICRKKIVDRFSFLFRHDNPRFDEDKFRKTCYAK